MNEFEQSVGIINTDFYSYCKKAVELYGNDIQLIITMEELAELIQGISKLMRYNNENTVINNLISEIIDVDIMLTQLTYILKKKIGVKEFYIRYKKEHEIKVNNLKTRLEL